MKKVMFLVLCGLLFSVGAAFADPVAVGDNIQFDGTISGFNGGPFLVYDDAAPPNFLFATFCIERNENLDFSHLFKVDTISNSAVEGGLAGGSPDPISEETAWLFLNWRAGTLAAATSGQFDPTEEDWLKGLQIAIWFLEGEQPNLTPEANTLIGSATAAVTGGFQNNNRVKVVNIVWTVNSGSWQVGDPAQSILTVPDPSVLLLLGTGLLGFGLRRKRS